MRFSRRLILLVALASFSVLARDATPSCGDLDSDGDVDADDAGILRAELSDSAQMSLAQELACDVISEARAAGLDPDLADLAGRCSMSDAAVMQRAGISLPPGGAPVCAIGSSEDCCSAHAGVGCEAPETVACVCAQEPSCCTTGWSASCATLACTTACEPGCTANAVAAENCKSSADGVVDRSVWDVPEYEKASVCYQPAPAPQCSGQTLPIPSIEGFSTQFSVAPGETVDFKIDNRTGGNPPLQYSADVFRLGWYRGAGARRVAQFAIPAQAQQPACDTKCISSTVPCPLTESFRDCSNWATSAQWTVPLDAVSGVYLAKFTKPNLEAAHVIFVVREAPGAAPADLLYQLDDHTWQAYNDGADDYGHYLYYDQAPYSISDRPHAVSYNRPFRNRYGSGPHHFFFEVDLALISFLERNGFSVGYAGSPDLDAHPELLAGRKVYVAGGHDEYWTGERRNAVEAAVTAGTHLLFLGTQHSFSKTRWQNVAGLDPRRVVVAYKYASAASDPRRNQDDWSGLWRDTRAGQAWTRPATQPARPESALSGTATAAAAMDGADLTVPSSMAGQRFWRNTCAAAPGCNLGDRNVGFEYDVRTDRYYEVHTSQQPPGLFSVSATNMARPLDQSSYSQLLWGVTPLQDAADFTLPRLTTEATLHRKPSGALVFAASTMRWSWGLDAARNDGSTGSSSRAVQQATVNLLADMGIQPAFLHKDPTNLADPELVRATPSADTTPPTSHFTQLNPANGVITGTASDVGGVVAGVEISFDAGVTWHGATLSESGPSTSWSYASVVPANVGGLVRAVDDSANLEIAHGSDDPIPPSSGSSVFSVAGNPAWQQVIAKALEAQPGWTSIVPMNLDGVTGTDLVSYNAVTGQAVYSFAVSGASCPAGIRCEQQVASSIAAAPGWTSIVPMDLNGDLRTDLLSYDAATGLSYYSLAISGASCPSGVYCNQQTLPRVLPGVPDEGGPFGPVPEAAVGWTSIVPMNLDGAGGTDLLLYAAATGLAEYTVADANGCASGVYCRQMIVATADAAVGWTAVVPLDLNGDDRTDLLSYNAATGKAAYSVARSTGCAGGTTCWQEVVSAVDAAPGFTSILPLDLNGDGRTDLLSYNAATGQSIYSVASSAGCAPGIYCAQTVVDVQAAAPGWSLIVPLQLNADLLSDLLSYR